MFLFLFPESPHLLFIIARRVSIARLFSTNSLGHKFLPCHPLRVYLQCVRYKVLFNLFMYEKNISIFPIKFICCIMFIEEYVHILHCWWLYSLQNSYVSNIVCFVFILLFPMHGKLALIKFVRCLHYFVYSSTHFLAPFDILNISYTDNLVIIELKNINIFIVI